MTYAPLFDPKSKPDVAIDSDAGGNPAIPRPEGDRSQRPVYEYTDAIKLAVNVALATGRPLLLRGDPGCGKSSLARHVAHCLKWRYYEEVITSRTQAQDLQWRFDSLRRLRDAQRQDADLSPVRYVIPGILWWALQNETARYRGVSEKDYPQDLKPLEDRAAPNKHERAVVLLDEIDKADPDVPNNLLDVLGSRHFIVEDLRDVGHAESEVTGPAPMIFITTNGERELPEAFLRRCVVLKLEPHNERMLKRIARKHFPARRYPLITEDLLDSVYRRLQSLADEAKRQKLRAPSTAEFLDTLWACHTLEVDENDPQWESITRATLWKAKLFPETDAPDKTQEAGV